MGFYTWEGAGESWLSQEGEDPETAASSGGASGDIELPNTDLISCGSHEEDHATSQPYASVGDKTVGLKTASAKNAAEGLVHADAAPGVGGELQPGKGPHKPWPPPWTLQGSVQQQCTTCITQQRSELCGGKRPHRHSIAGSFREAMSLRTHSWDTYREHPPPSMTATLCCKMRIIPDDRRHLVS